jgi:hypothetical protein
LKIVFYKSNSINYRPVIEIAEKFTGFTQSDRTTEIKIWIDEIFEKIFHIENLFSFIESWKHTEITY